MGNTYNMKLQYKPVILLSAVALTTLLIFKKRLDKSKMKSYKCESSLARLLQILAILLESHWSLKIYTD